MQDEENMEQTNDNGQEQNKSQNPSSLKNKAKSGLKNIGKKISKSFKEGLKQLWRMIPIHIKLIIIGIVLAILLIALVVLVILEHTTAKSSDNIDNYFSSTEVSQTPSGQMYNNTGSLLLLTDDQVDKLTKTYLSSIKNNAPSNYQLYQKKPRYIIKDNSGVKLLSGAISLSKDVNIYEHILNSERYNFNRIDWKEYNRDSTTGKTPEMVVDKETMLQYPKDQEKQLDYFVNLMRPYLQSWVIPFSMMAGVTTDTSHINSINFAYEIIAKAYHKIEMEKRIMQSIDIITQYKDYDKITYEVSITRTCKTVTNPYEEEEKYYEYEMQPCHYVQIMNGSCPDNPKPGYKMALVEKTRTVTKQGVQEICTDSAPVTKEKSREHVIEKPVEIKRTIYNKNVYNYKNLYVFDKVIEYTNIYKKYNLNSQADREDKEEEEYNYGTPNLPKIATTAKSGTYTSTYEIKDGLLYTVTSNWNDSITTTSQTRTYTVADVEKNIGTTLSGGDLSYYQNLEKSKELNLVDIMNASSVSYNNYIKTKSVSKNIGYTREQLQVSYRLLKKYLSDILSSHPMSFSYGASFGIKEGMSGALLGFSLDVVQNLDTNATYVKPIQDPKRILKDNLVATGVYGYAGHKGIDLSYPYSSADASKCNDLTNYRCPYVSGPPVYSVREGTIYEVGYSAYNKYHNTGTTSGNSKEGNLIINDTSWGSYVKIKHDDGNLSIYAHLFPDKQFLKSLSDKIGERIAAGTFVGYMGNTGNSSGLHLHFEYAPTLSVLGNGARTLAVLRLAGM